jgi:hypothetical protein
MAKGKKSTKGQTTIYKHSLYLFGNVPNYRTFL